jgi:hypothetical protein
MLLKKKIKIKLNCWLIRLITIWFNLKFRSYIKFNNTGFGLSEGNFGYTNILLTEENDKISIVQSKPPRGRRSTCEGEGESRDLNEQLYIARIKVRNNKCLLYMGKQYRRNLFVTQVKQQWEVGSNATSISTDYIQVKEYTGQKILSNM